MQENLQEPEMSQETEHFNKSINFYISINIGCGNSCRASFILPFVHISLWADRICHRSALESHLSLQPG